MRYRVGLGAVMATVIMTFGTPANLTAQLGVLGDIRVGGAFPTGDLAEVTGRGLSFGAGIAAQMVPRIALRTDLAASFLQGKDLDSGSAAPDVKMIHGVVGLEALVRASHFLPISTSLSGGWTRMTVEEFSLPDAGEETGTRPIEAEKSLHPTLVAGANIGLFGSRGSSPVITLGAHAVRIFGDESKFADLQSLVPSADDLANSTYFVARLGVRFGF
ncbi:MAG TPA: hypothetical protein VFI91_12390 [Longimicrobiaceae bacterium]|nr:hypothetical protein [Longimicrobiaceae bacterium]